MNVSVIIPAQASEEAMLARTLCAVFEQRYDAGRIEVFVAQYGGGATISASTLGQNVRYVAVDHPSPYAARNAAARDATGELLLFTEPGCVPDAKWASNHVDSVRRAGVTLSVGHVAGARETWALRTFTSYEDLRDEWVFSGHSWQHMFGRPKNMGIVRHRFESHGPFAEAMRGSDSKLVQYVARELSTSEVGYAPLAIVRQEAVRGLPSCLLDRFRHGRALRVHRSGHAAPIRLGDRVTIFRTTVTRRDYGPIASIALLSFLAAGIVAFRLGGASARVR